MAEELKGAHWDKRGWSKLNGGNNRYPWHEWLNGSMWLLIQGDDFDMDTTRFQRYIWDYGDNHGIKIKTKRHENMRDLYIKAHKRTVKDGLERSRHFRNLGKRMQGKKWWEPADDFIQADEEDEVLPMSSDDESG